MGPATTRAAARNLIAARFRAAGLTDPEREAQLVIAAAAGFRALDLIADPEAQLGSAVKQVEAFASRRELGEPLSRIRGEREFWSLRFSVTPDVLDPRADSETVVEAALASLAARRTDALRIVDFGVGSGAILAALLAEFPNASGLGIDSSEKTTETARQNLAALGLGSRALVSVGRWGEALSAAFDLIVSNPPYIPSGEIAALAREVRDYDPYLALDGGADGLDAYRELAPHIARLLEPAEGRFVLEHGRGQSPAVQAILESNGLRVLSTRNDLGGVERVVVGGVAGAF